MVPRQSQAHPQLLWVWLAALASTVVAWWARPLLPIDETRYVSVAWEMWHSHEFLVPHINGVTYSHKPPLLFWLMHAGWSVFGVHLWWPRLLGFLFLTADALLLRRLLSRLWPGESGRRIGNTAAAMLLGTLWVFLFGTLIMFDLLLLAWVLLAWLGLVEAQRGTSILRSALYFGVAIGGGILAKGPVILLFSLPPALAARLWCGALPGRAKAVGLTAFLGTLLGAALALAWAIPAGIAGGPEYRDAIFWGQTAGRVTDSFAHARPWYWYLPILPGTLLPWPLLLCNWRRWRHQPPLNSGNQPSAWRFLLWSSLPTFILLSFMSGKQPHYLLPIVTMLLSALAAHAVFHPRSRQGAPGDRLIPTLLLLLAGFFLLRLPQIAAQTSSMAWLSEASPMTGAFLLATALLWWFASAQEAWRPTLHCLLIPIFFAFLHLGMRTPLEENYGLQAMAHRVSVWQQEGQQVAFFAARYHGQYTFLGRLKQPVANPESLPGLRTWASSHPDGHLLVVLDKHAPPSYSSQATEILPYGVQRLAVWRAADFLNAQP